MITYGLIGYPLSHSFSKKYFKEKFLKEAIQGTNYELFPLEKITDLTQLLKEQTSLKGLNVTIPYKEAVIPFLDDWSEAAKEIGAVNTIRISNGKLKGFNTDVYGFEHSLKPLLEGGKQKALILGSGGAAKAVVYCLRKMGVSYSIVSRNPKNGAIAYGALEEEIKNCSLIVNTTPLGMQPNIDTFPPIPYHLLNENHLLYDLIYNPAETSFLEKGKKQKARIKNGQEMLVLQAEQAWAIWNH